MRALGHSNADRAGLLGSGEACWARRSDWNLQQLLERDDTLVTWTSPTPIDDGLPSHDFEYEITSVGIYYGGNLTPDDETDRYAAANDLTGSGRVGPPSRPRSGRRRSREPITDTSFDLELQDRRGRLRSGDLHQHRVGDGPRPISG